MPLMLRRAPAAEGPRYISSMDYAMTS